MDISNYKNKKVLVVGMARSGIASVNAMLSLGAKVTVQDSKDESKVSPELLEMLNKNGVVKHFAEFPSDEESFDMIIMSPGVNPELPFIQKEVKKGAELVGELEIAFRLSKSNYVAITGTNGKTTTTTLTGEIFKASGRKTAVVGNIGIAVISRALTSEPDEWFITETSSFQLQTITEYHPKVSAILNITPDHLDRHGTLENYARTKARVAKNQTEDEYLILNYDDKLCYSLGEYTKAKIVPFSRKEKLEMGAYLDGEMLVIKDEQGTVHELCNQNELRIIGGHNVENALAASAVAFFAGVEVEAISKALKEFGGVEHRIEFVEEIDGVRYYNDSKGTNVDAANIALKAFGKNVILIAGGDAKSQDFTELAENFGKIAKHVVLLGRDAYMIQEACDKVGYSNYSFEKTMRDCVKKAHDIAEPGDVVLLSPACASWDMYPNFEVRGREFKDLVREYL